MQTYSYCLSPVEYCMSCKFPCAHELMSEDRRSVAQLLAKQCELKLQRVKPGVKVSWAQSPSAGVQIEHASSRRYRGAITLASFQRRLWVSMSAKSFIPFHEQTGPEYCYSLTSAQSLGICEKVRDKQTARQQGERRRGGAHVSVVNAHAGTSPLPCLRR